MGCELEKTESELVDGKCPIHPNKILEIIEEENYFFRFSRYQKQLLELYKNNHLFVLPREKYNEIVAFVAGGLQDFSISRVKAKMPWGILVPGDDAQMQIILQIFGRECRLQEKITCGSRQQCGRQC